MAVTPARVFTGECRNVTRAVVLAVLVLALATGCRSLTGRPFGTWVDDKTLAAKVKTRLAGEDVRTLTRISVDTYQGTVYLLGAVPDLETRRRIEGVAQGVDGVGRVVSNLYLADPLAAAPRDVPPAPPHPGPGFARLQLETGTPAWTRYAAFDGTGRRVATVYVVAAGAPERVSLRELGGEAPGIQHVSIDPPSPEAATGYRVVLWHVSREEAEGLR
jgi:hypothetical protein